MTTEDDFTAAADEELDRDMCRLRLGDRRLQPSGLVAFPVDRDQRVSVGQAGGEGRAVPDHLIDAVIALADH